MSSRNRGSSIPKAVEAALREFINALGKSAMYPAGHRFVADSAAALADRLVNAMLDRDSLTIGITPRGLLIDGAAVEPLPMAFREFAVRLHRKNIGTIHISRGAPVSEVEQMVGALAAGDADETVGREGLRLSHIRVEPLTYEVLGFGDPLGDGDLDDAFWMLLVEAAFGRRLADEEGLPTPAQIAEAISERAALSTEGARRVYEALAAFSSALASRGDRASGSARRRFVDVLSALSRPTTTRVLAAAPSPASRRRFVRETLELVPAALLLQLLESVAEADGEPISPQLRWLLGKLAGAGGEGPGEPVASSGAFAVEVLGLVAQWEGVTSEEDEEADPRLGLEPARVVAIGLDLALASPLVITAGRALADRGHLLEVLQLLDHAQNRPEVVRAIADGVLDEGLLARLLKARPLDFVLIDRVARQSGTGAVEHLVDALATAPERSTRRRLLEMLMQIGPATERMLLERLTNASWYLARNILSVLSQFPTIENLDPVFAALAQPEIRVRQEALKVLLRQEQGRVRAITEALESGEESLARMALAALGSDCPPSLVAPVLHVLSLPDEDLRLQAIRALAESGNPLVVPHLLALVRAKKGFLKRPRLLPRSPVMLAALEVLARRWPNHRPVLAALQLAHKSPDSDVRAIVGGRA